MRLPVHTTLAFSMFLAASTAVAFNPPEDKAGPLAARINGPAKVTEVEKPVPMHVVITNQTPQPVSGTVRLQVVDSWSATPAEPVAFTAPGSGAADLPFTVTAGKGTYNALYPVHAFVEFDAGGAHQLAHPVLIVEAQLPEVPYPPMAVPWQPIPVAANASLELLRAPIYRPIIQVIGENPQVLAPGWHGSDGRTRASVVPGGRVARPDAREALSMHPPWYQGLAGTVLVEYPLSLPPKLPAHLKFAIAIRDTTANEPPSDGVLFRVRVLPFDAPAGQFGKTVWERFTNGKTWYEASVDLKEFSGRQIRVQFECHPGPKNDTTCDQAFWAQPTVATGTPPPAGFVNLENRRALGAVQIGDKHYDVHVATGARGLLDGEVTFACGDAALAFRGFEIQVAGDRIDTPGSVTEFLGITDESSGQACKIRHRFRNWLGNFDLVGEAYVENGKAFRVKFEIENAPPPQPWSVVYLEDVATGPWNAAAHQIYAGVGNVIREPKAFELGFDGHQLSTSFVGFDFVPGLSMVQAVDVPPSKLEVAPDAHCYTLHAPLTQTLTFIPASSVWQGVKSWREIDPRKAAGGVPKLAGRFVFDLWGGGYEPSARALERAFRYGLTDSVVVWHNWQRWGYDYRLPDIWPPNPEYGTVEQFQALARTCKDHGVLFAPHDNYIDFYPDAEGFSYDHVAFTREGDPLRAWLNEGRGAQAFRWRTGAFRPFVERNLKSIRDNVAPTAYFIDVWSSIGPYESWARDGQFFDRVATRNSWGETFAWIRETLGDNAPQISESGHDQLIGYLDGSQTNHLRACNPVKGAEWLTWNVRCADAERIPWLDAAYHDRFLPHGAGYEGRYAGGLDTDLHGIYSDDYIASEALTGHPGMVPAPFHRNVIRQYWLLHDLMRALALKRIDTVEFASDDLHRQHVRWENAGGVWVNRGATDWTIDGHVLPEYGFYAHIGDVEAAIERSDGLMVEWSKSPQMQYVNARAVVDDRLPVTVTAASVRYLGGRNVALALRWHADRPLSEPATVFAHFVDQAGKIAFQADHQPPTPATQWQGDVETTATTQLPEACKPGDTFDLRVGLCRADLGRLPLRGPCDNERRIRLGTLRFDGEEKGAANAIAWTPLEAPPDLAAARANPEGRPVSFGTVITQGGCRLTREAGAPLTITPLPDSPKFTLQLDRKALPFGIPEPKRIEALDETGKPIGQSPIASEGDHLTITCEPGPFAYRLITD